MKVDASDVRKFPCNCAPKFDGMQLVNAFLQSGLVSDLTLPEQSRKLNCYMSRRQQRVTMSSARKRRLP